MRFGELDNTALILMSANVIMWSVNIGLLSLWTINRVGQQKVNQKALCKSIPLIETIDYSNNQFLS